MWAHLHEGKKRKSSTKTLVLSFQRVLKTKNTSQINHMQATGHSLSGLHLFLGLVIEATPRCSLMQRDELGESSRPGAPNDTFGVFSLVLVVLVVGAIRYQVSGNKYELYLELVPISWTLW